MYENVHAIYETRRPDPVVSDDMFQTQPTHKDFPMLFVCVLEWVSPLEMDLAFIT